MMGYYPPYVPDSYLLSVRPISNPQLSVKRVEAISHKKIEVQNQNHPFQQKPFKTYDGKGNLFDQYA